MKRFNHTRIASIILAIGLLIGGGCSEVLDLEPPNKLPIEDVFTDPNGLKLYLANLYYQMPIEDFRYGEEGWHSNTNGGRNRAMYTDEAIHTEWIGNYGVANNSMAPHYWEQGYRLIRDVNLLLDAVPALDITQVEKDRMVGEALFIRSYAYFGLAMRYGGLPLIAASQEYNPDDLESLKVPRSTEKETFEFILSQLDESTGLLPDSWGGERRATKWAAQALKSRVGLYAGTLAKYWHLAALEGEAVEQGLVGMDPSDANTFLAASIAASEEVMNSGQFSLYAPTPSTPEEATENYIKMFQDPNAALNEAIFIRGFNIVGRGHNYDYWFSPAQVRAGAPHPGRLNPLVETVDLFEAYTNPGISAPIMTTTDPADVDDYNGYDPSKTYLRFDDPLDPFKDKDARLHAYITLPGSIMRGEEIVIQAGLIEPDGTPQIKTGINVTVDGVTYYAWGAESTEEYSGFNSTSSVASRNTKTGFLLRKFLQETGTAQANAGTSDWMDMRYAEILLNYAEAVVESGLGDVDRATKALNDIRRRAAFMTPIPLTLENVLRERRIELLFENKRDADMKRRREHHVYFNNRLAWALLPVLDLSVSPPKYIFVRDIFHAAVERPFPINWYYYPIPNVAGNGLVQNPTG
jgi:starch-binding outer membrane protein, SusD/RagB family